MKIKKILAILLSTSIVAALFVGCSGNSKSSKELNDLKEEVSALRFELDELYEYLYLEGFDDSGYFVGDGDEDFSKEKDKPSKEVEDFASQVEVINVGSFSTTYRHYVAVNVKNNSEAILDIDMNVNFYDADKNIIGTGNNSAYPIGPGQEYVLYVDNDTLPDSFDYEITAVKEDSKYVTYLTDKLSHTITTLDDKVIVTVTNDGETTINDANGIIVLYKDGKMVELDHLYLDIPKTGLLSGKTISQERKFYKAPEYDEVKFFVVAYNYN